MMNHIITRLNKHISYKRERAKDIIDDYVLKAYYFTYGAPHLFKIKTRDLSKPN